MNVLMFVMTMLMLMALLTYAKLESFRSASGLQAEFQRYMEKRERAPITNGAIKLYDSVSLSTKNAKQDQKKNPASPRLSIYTLIDKKSREADPKMYNQIYSLTRNLMVILFAKQPFFQEYLSQRETTDPNSVFNDVIDQLMKAVDSLPEEQQITKTTDLLNLNLGDAEPLFYLMLKGCPCQTSSAGQSEQKQETVMDLVPTEDDAEAEALAAAEVEEPKSGEGHCALLDYITVEKKDKIRIYLASRALLLAIYNNADVVDEIIRVRNALYKQLDKNDWDNSKATASAQFERFKSAQTDNVDPGMLDFGVSGTNPNNYE